MSGLVCYFLKYFFKIEYTFDPRSLYPLECISAKRIIKKSFSFKFWIFIEKLICVNSSKVICVSYGMQRYYNIMYKLKNTKIVPCFSDIEIDNNNVTKNQFLQKLKIPKNKIILLYYGV